MADQWYYTKDGKSKIGPVTFAELQQLASSGVVQPSDMVFGGEGKWTQAQCVPGLFLAIQVQPSQSLSSAPPPIPIHGKQSRATTPAKGFSALPRGIRLGIVGGILAGLLFLVVGGGGAVFFLLRWRIAPAEALNGPDDLALPQAALQAPKGIKQYDFEAFCLAARNEDPGFVGSTIEVQLPWDTLWKHNDGSVSFSGGAATGGEYIRCYPAFIFEGIKRHPWPIVRCRVLKVQWPPRAERDPAWKAGDNFIVVVDHCRIVTNEVDFNPPIDKRGFTHWLNSVAAGELERKGK